MQLLSILSVILSDMFDFDFRICKQVNKAQVTLLEEQLSDLTNETN